MAASSAISISSSYSLLLITSSSSSPSPSSTRTCLQSVSSPTPTTMSRLHVNQKCFSTALPILKQRVSTIVKASSDIDGTSLPDNSSERAAVDAVPVENLPLESKEQMKLEAKIRMRLARKIRLRRKRLVRKRQMRKKGRWPPAKVKKNKNV